MIAHSGGTGNTRLIPQEDLTFFSHLDYLSIRVCLFPLDFESFLDFIDSSYLAKSPGSVWSPGGGAVSFENKIYSLLGVSGGYTEDLETGYIDCMVQISGQYFSGITISEQWEMLTILKYSFDSICTRIDIAVDDSSFSNIPLDGMLKAFDDGNNFGFRKQSYAGTKVWKDEKIVNEETIYFGSRNSGKMVRVYNHYGDHYSHCMRFEAEFKKNYANIVFDLLADINPNWFSEDMEIQNQCMDAIVNWSNRLKLNNLENPLDSVEKGLHGCSNKWELILQKIMGSIAVSCIDFRDKSVRKDRQKASYKDTKRLTFYQEFMDKVGTEIKTRIPTKRVTIEKTIAWMQRQVSKTMSIIHDSLPDEYYRKFHSQFIKLGRKKQSGIDKKVIRLIIENPQICL